jgi:hypothetical protein
MRESLLMIVGAVLIWRGIWVLLDLLDKQFFGGNHISSALVGIVVGIILFFLADRDLEDVV